MNKILFVFMLCLAFVATAQERPGGGGTASPSSVGIYNLTPGGGNPLTAATTATPAYPGQIGVGWFTSHDFFVFGGQTASSGDFNKRSFSFPGGIAQVGDNTGAIEDTLTDSTWYVGYGSTARAATGDSLFKLDCGNTNAYNSGVGFNLNINVIDPVTGLMVPYDTVGCSWMYIFTNRIPTLLPGWAQMVNNAHAGVFKGLAFTGPGLGGNDSGNYSVLMLDYINYRLRIPYMTPGCYQPTDTPYTFLANGMTDPPVQGDSYINNGTRWIVIGNTIFTNSAPNIAGAILMTPYPPGSPSGISGTLTRVHGAHASTITFTNTITPARWADSVNINPLNGLTYLAALTVTNKAAFEGPFWVGTGSSAGGGFQWNDGAAGNAYINLSHADPTSRLSVTNLTTLSRNTFAAGPLSLDVGGNGSGMNYESIGSGGFGLNFGYSSKVTMTTTYDGWVNGANLEVGGVQNGLQHSGGPNANLQVDGSFAADIITVTANIALGGTNSSVLLNGTTLVATLPDASSHCKGRFYYIKLIATSTATVQTTSAQTIDGSAPPYSLSAKNKYVKVQSDGANWQIMANN